MQSFSDRWTKLFVLARLDGEPEPTKRTNSSHPNHVPSFLSGDYQLRFSSVLSRCERTDSLHRIVEKIRLRVGHHDGSVLESRTRSRIGEMGVAEVMIILTTTTQQHHVVDHPRFPLRTALCSFPPTACAVTAQPTSTSPKQPLSDHFHATIFLLHFSRCGIS